MTPPKFLPLLLLIPLLAACPTSQIQEQETFPPPTITLAASSSSVNAPGPITLNVDASAKAGVARVEFYRGEAKVFEDTSSPYSFEVSLAATDNGLQTFSAKAFDTKNQSTSSEPVNVLVDIDVTAPTVSLESSTTNLTAAGSITLTATATDDKGVFRVEFYRGDAKLGEKTSSPYTWTLSLTDADNGVLALSAKAFDADNNVGTSNTVTATVDIDATAPTVSLEASSTNVTATGTITLTATASDNKGIARVEFYEGAVKVGQDTNSPYTLDIAFLPEGNGTHTYTAKAIDTSDNSAVSSNVSVIVNIVVFTQVALGNWHSCGLTSSGKAYCWGANNVGQLGNNTITATSQATAVTMPSGVSFTQIAGGDTNTCAVGSDAKAYCWGNNSTGRLGDGTLTNRTTPTAVSMPVGVTVTQIATGDIHGCALGSDGRVYCWGSNDSGRLGIANTTAYSLSPVAVTLPSGVTSFSKLSSGAARHTCALANTGDWYCWGSNTSGSLGNGTTTSTTDGVPVKLIVPSGVAFSSINVRSNTTSGYGTSCAMGSDLNAYCWGAAVGPSSPTAVTTTGLPAGVSLSSVHPGGEYFICGLGSDRKVYCKANNDYGQFGDGTTTSSFSSFVAASTGSVAVSSLVVGNRSVCAIGTNTKTYCWGLGTSGQLGHGSAVSSSTPVAVVIP